MEKSQTPYFFLLESSFGGRWTIAAWNPLKVIKAEGSRSDFFQQLQEAIRETPPIDAPDLPFAGGWIGYLGYELYPEIEKAVPPREPDLIPKAVFCFFDSFYLYDHLNAKDFLFTGRLSSGNLPSGPAELAGMMQRFRSGPGLPGAQSLRLKVRSDRSSDLRTDSPRSRRMKSNFTESEYLATVRKIKNYITAGDCYQVNLAQRFCNKTYESPYEIYQRLRSASPAPYSAYLNLGNTQILSSSPECFLDVQGRKVTTRPIKGTRPRGQTPDEDKRLKEELEGSAKDHAELLMITDLERNDLGRVCRPGSVRVTELRKTESFAHVHHLASTIQGELDEKRDVVDLLQATFPGGSITGAPKIRAMQIIRELEPHPRNVYCGAIGYVSQNGRAQFNIAIRTMIIKNKTAWFWAGGGIVTDSDPEAEYEETLTKARGMIEALNPNRRDNRRNFRGLKKLRKEEPRQEPDNHKDVIDPDRMEPSQDHHHP